MERKRDFVYTYRECVQQLLDTEHTGFWHLDWEVVDTHVKKMLNSGWSKEKILHECSTGDEFSYRFKSVSLIQLVYRNHAILTQFTDEEIRSSLFRMAATMRANEESELFRAKLFPDNEWIGVNSENRLSSLTRFLKMLSQEGTPAAGIRNK